MDVPPIRINKALRQLDISLQEAYDYLHSKNILIEANPNTIISGETYFILCDGFNAANRNKNKKISKNNSIEQSAIDNLSVSTNKQNNNDVHVNVLYDRNNTVKEFNSNKVPLVKEYFRKNIVVSNLNRAKNHFVEQYGNNELYHIKEATLNSINVKNLYISLENKYCPSAAQIMDAVSFVEYINTNTNYYLKSAKDLEKRIDFINIAAILILENWLFNLLPYQEKNPAQSLPNMGVVEMGWMMSENIWDQIFTICKNIESQSMSKINTATPDYDDLFTEALDLSLKHFGQEKFLKVYNKIQTSNKISDLIRVSHQNRIAPNKNDFLYSLKEVPFFIFSGNDTHTLGALLAHNRWNEECNKHLHLADELMLIEVLGGILEGFGQH